MLKNVVRICVFLALFSKVFCQSHLTQQDWDLASTINFRELAEYYQYGSTGCRVFKQGIFIYAVYFKILLRKKSEVSKLCGFVTTII